MLILWIILGIVAYLNLGYLFGMWSWRVYYHNPGPKWLDILLWPVEAITGGDLRTNLAVLFIASGFCEDKPRNYCIVMAFAWGPKVFIQISSIAVIYGLVMFFKFVIFILLSPVRLVSEKNKPKPQPKKENSTKPDLSHIWDPIKTKSEKKESEPFPKIWERKEVGG